MAGWIDELLKAWRAHFGALAPHDNAAPLDETGPPPTHALDLLREHVARSGVQLTLCDAAVRSPAPDLRTAHLKAVEIEARDATPATAPVTGLSRFGRRQYPASAEGAIDRFARLPQDALSTPAQTRRAAQAFRASAYGEVEALRADVTRLKEALADVLVENRSLKRTLEAQRDAGAA